MAYLYILQSLKNMRYYVGVTSNLQKRLEDHNYGRSGYTKLTKPYRLVFSKEFSTKDEAIKTERSLKRLKSKKIIDKIVISQKLTLGS